jgi:hypothetical protein
VLAYQYDVVCNGVELSSGAVRNHLPEVMEKAFAIAGTRGRGSNVPSRPCGTRSATAHRLMPALPPAPVTSEQLAELHLQVVYPGAKDG